MSDVAGRCAILGHHTFIMLTVSHSRIMPSALKGEMRLGLFILKTTATKAKYEVHIVIVPDVITMKLSE